jgi:hypothetical protein
MRKYFVWLINRAFEPLSRYLKMYLQAFCPKTYSMLMWHPYLSRRNGLYGMTRLSSMTSMTPPLRFFWNVWLQDSCKNFFRFILKSYFLFLRMISLEHDPSLEDACSALRSNLAQGHSRAVDGQGGLVLLNWAPLLHLLRLLRVEDGRNWCIVPLKKKGNRLRVKM